MFAKKNNGQFILRVEDTDQERNKESFLKEQLMALHWLGIHWDEGPKLSSLSEATGNYGPYRQSQRMNIYQKYAQQLIEKGMAYYCFLTDEEINHKRKIAVQNHQPFRVISPYRDWDLKKALHKKQNSSAVVRLKVSDETKTYQLKDGVRGMISFPSDMVGDFVLLRSNGVPVYNFCCAVDDALMNITHVFRAEEHLANTLRQLMVLDGLAWKAPQYFHLSLILDKEKKKLSKRSGALSCLEYKDRGYLPQSLNNFLALLGWSAEDGKEIFSFKELIQNFSEKRLNPAPAVFDEEKLKWMNACHLRQMPHDQLWSLLKTLCDKENLEIPDDFSWVDKALLNLKDSFSNLVEAVAVFKLLSKDGFDIQLEAEEIKKWPYSKEVLQLWKQSLEERNEVYISKEVFKEIKNKIQKELGIKGKFLFMPIRVAMIGKLHGLELNAVVELIKRSLLVDRAKQTLSHLFPLKRYK